MQAKKANMTNCDEMVAVGSVLQIQPEKESDEEAKTPIAAEGDEVHAENDLEMGYIAVELVSAPRPPQDGCGTSSSGSSDSNDSDPAAPDHDAASSTKPRQTIQNNMIDSAVVPIIRRTDSTTEDPYHDNSSNHLQKTTTKDNLMLSESSKMTAATSRDMSGTDFSAAFGGGGRTGGGGGGNKMRLSNVAESTSRIPQVGGDGEEGTLTDEARFQNQQDLLEREERKYMKQQIVFCIVFTVLLVGGVGVCVALQIRRT